MVPADKHRLTYLDYARLPEGAPCQLIDGDFVMTPLASTAHQRVCVRIAFALQQVVTEGNVGEVFFAPMDVYFTETETFQPDVIFISTEHLSIIKEKRIEGAPDLVVEILSPSTGYFDLTHKKSVYEALGVAEYWIVDPQERTVEVWRNGDAGFVLLSNARHSGRLQSDLLRGFAVDVGKLLKGL